ncbi:MAG: Uncharacterised protein [Flavobacteriia bacterium]|nr:MAG: Uncharacterised protein [Flavobacteriia bacterium]
MEFDQELDAFDFLFEYIFKHQYLLHTAAFDQLFSSTFLEFFGPAFGQKAQVQEPVTLHQVPVFQI